MGIRKYKRPSSKPFRKNFKKPLDLVCSKDKLRPVINHIYFDDGKSVCSDTLTLLIRDLKLDFFTDEEIQQMNGKFLHYEVFKEIFRYNEVRIIDGKIECLKNQVKSVFEFSKCENPYPNYKAVFPEKFKPTEQIKLSLKRLSVIKKISENENLVFKFSGHNKPVTLTSTDNLIKETILIMPISMSDYPW